MTITLPQIEINFKQLANNFIKRSERGIAILIIKDDTNKTFSSKEYKKLSEIDTDVELYSIENLQYIKDVLIFGASKVIIVRIDTTQTIVDALEIVQKITKTGWITTVGTTDDYSAIQTWIKAKEENAETFKAITYKANNPNCKHIVNFYNDKVTFADERAEQAGEKYLPSLLGILASCNAEKGSTYFVCNNLIKVQEVSNNDEAVNQGHFILINDFDNVKVGLGINSLTTFTKNNVEDMRYIDIVETMDLISDDIRSEFKNNYVGQYKNNLDNQILFISAINTYFNNLSKNEILDNSYKNCSDVNIEAQRQAWIEAGKAEADSWSEQEVKAHTYKRSVFLAGDIKILGAMENLQFNIAMF